MGKKVLVIGQGGREHALVWKLAQSPQIEKIYAAPGNPGMAELAQCIDIAADDIDKLLGFARSEGIHLTVVGPEVPLMAGIVDRFQEAGLKIFGPTAAAARLEGSKVFTKELMKKYAVPTASFDVFQDIHRARSCVRTYTDQGKMVVIKADGLAAGKGVVVARDWEEANQALDSIMLKQSFGEAGARVVIEECLYGEEVSVFVISDGHDFVSLISAQDHKQVFDHDQGPNTGGMGAYVNPPVYTPQLHQKVEESIVSPVLKAMAAEGYPFQGVLYAGLMITAEGPKVLEFNARFGDPETQVVMPMIEGDILPLLEAAVDKRLAGYQVNIAAGTCICVVLASAGYPGNYKKGKLITGLDNLNRETMVFHSGTARKDGQLLTNGGRVLALAVRGSSMEEAIDQVYQELKKIHFEGMHYRSDIGRKSLRQGV
ncbi:MAG: phosphoribosylamine--glycine ligase [Syntrophomonadaceae bacterium]|nr:phosphoribosylamine--glycine ligase [Syntrophomonadaceae bacterium]